MPYKTPFFIVLAVVVAVVGCHRVNWMPWELPQQPSQNRHITIKWPDNSSNSSTFRNWNFATPENNPDACLEIALNKIELDSSPRCFDESLQAFDGDSTSSPRIVHICGSKKLLPRPIKTKSNSLLVSLKSNGKLRPDKGVEAVVRTVEDCRRQQVSRQNCGTSKFEPILEFEPLLEGSVLGRITGGNESIPHSWPWQVVVYRIVDGPETRKKWCGGTLVSRRHIVSAAHCFFNHGTNDPADYEIWAGKHDLNKRETGKAQQLTAAAIIVHEQFGKNSSKPWDSDIAIIRLQEPGATFTDYVRPICLPNEGIPAARPGDLCFATGFGETKDPSSSDRLRQVRLPIIDQTDCTAKSVPTLAQEITDKMICAGYLEEGGRDTCKGDSGGPLACQNGPLGNWVLSGIVSFGYECGQRKAPGVYTHVKRFMTWLGYRIKDLPPN